MVWAGEHNDKEEGFGLADDFIDECFGLEDDGDDEGFGLKDENEENSRQLALRLASLGCLVVCIDRDGDTNKTTVNDIQVRWKVQPIISALQEAGGIAWAFQCDVSKSEEVAQMAR